jgi:formate hydrogenlyase transcriptional activator
VLVRYLAQKYARRTKKRIDTIPAATLDTLSRWPWPGNVRELENVIERAVILSRGATLDVPLMEFTRAAADLAAGDGVRLDEVERDHIIRVLDSCGWVIGGPRGAASQLGLKRTTLASRMQKLGVRRPSR